MRSRDGSRGFQYRSRVFIHCMNFIPECIGCGKYTGELALSLASNGHSVEVVTTPPHYPGWTVKLPYKALRYKRERVGGVDVWRCPILARGGGGLWRAIAPLSFTIFAAPVAFARIILTRPDVVLCVEPTLLSAPAALLAARLVRARTVLHLQDLEIDAAFEVGHLKGRWLRRVSLAFERCVLRWFDLTVTISGKMREALLRKGLQADQVIVIRNWVDLDAVRSGASRRSDCLQAELGLDRTKYVILYAGHIGPKQALEVLLEAVRLCQQTQQLHFVVVGEGPRKADLIAHYGNLPNLTFLPLQPAEQFYQLLNLANLHILPSMKQVADLVLPSKLGPMLASGKPILAMAEPETELAEILGRSALLVRPGDSSALAVTIKNAASSDLGYLKSRQLRLANAFSSRKILPEFESALLGVYAGEAWHVHGKQSRAAR